LAKSLPGAADAPSDWTLLAAFMIEEKLAPDDLVRMIELGVAPYLETVRETVWVHRPSLCDWRELVKLYGFKTQREALAEHRGADTGRETVHAAA
jgi:hypothetical protein